MKTMLKNLHRWSKHNPFKCLGVAACMLALGTTLTIISKLPDLITGLLVGMQIAALLLSIVDAAETHYENKM